MAGRSWTEEEDNYIRENHEKLSGQEMANKLGRTTKAIWSRFGTLGLDKNGKGRHVKEGDKIEGTRLTLQKITLKKYCGQNVSFGLFRCDCGVEKIIKITAVRPGKTISCGCWKNEKSAISCKNRATHHKSNHKLYNTYNSMISRCYNTKEAGYEYWGGRGINVCKEWLDDFVVFYDWAIKNGWDKKLTIGRINNDGNYEPLNCQWETHKEQNNNKSSNVKILAFGEEKTAYQWADDERCGGANGGTISERINKLKWNPEKSITDPVREMEYVNKKYIGTSYVKANKNWKSYITIKQKRITLGHFSTEIEAAKCRDEYITKNNLEDSYELNFKSPKE